MSDDAYDKIGDPAYAEEVRLLAHIEDLESQLAAVTAESERLREEGERYSADAYHYERQLAAVTAERDVLKGHATDIIDGWNWWQVDPTDRCISVVTESIDETRAALAAVEESHE